MQQYTHILNKIINPSIYQVAALVYICFDSGYNAISDIKTLLPPPFPFSAQNDIQFFNPHKPYISRSYWVNQNSCTISGYERIEKEIWDMLYDIPQILLCFALLNIVFKNKNKMSIKSRPIFFPFPHTSFFGPVCVNNRVNRYRGLTKGDS